MRNLHILDKYRVDLSAYYGSIGDDKNGVFSIDFLGKTFDVIASNGGGWEHVSVSTSNYTPNWLIMSVIKKLFFLDDEVVMELHPKKDNYINNHPYCLHLWKPLKSKIPVPDVKLLNEINLNTKNVVKNKCKRNKEKLFITQLKSEEWEVLKVTGKKNYPTWDTLCEVKCDYFGADVDVMQLHNKEFNEELNTVYIFKPNKQKIPTPPNEMVGYKELNL